MTCMYPPPHMTTQHIHRMLTEDKHRCWSINGKSEIKEPTGSVYELLR